MTDSVQDSDVCSENSFQIPTGSAEKDLDRDISELISFVGVEHLLRGVPSSILLRGVGKIFSNKKGTDATYQLSIPVHRIGYFVSHNWATHRFFKFLTLAFKFNMPAALVTCVVSLTICSVLGMLGVLPTYPTNDGRHISIVARCIVVPLTICALFLGSSLRRCFRLAEPTAFLDKACIHQVDIELQQLGIRKLGAFLRKSDRMLVLYTPLYLRKLWTVYEVASFLSLHDISNLEVVPIILPCTHFLVMIGCVWFSIFSILTRHLELPTWVSFAVSWFGSSVYLACIRLWTKSKAEIQHTLANFDVANSHCAVESDRPVVYTNIVALMKISKRVKRTATDKEALEAFNQQVREELSAQFNKIFGRYAFSYMEYLVLALCIFAPYHADCWAEMGEGKPIRAVLGARCTDVFWNLFAIHVWHVGLETMSRWCLQLKLWQDVIFFFIINWFAVSIGVGTEILTDELSDRAETNDWLFAGLIAFQVCTTAASIYFVPRIASLHRTNTGRPVEHIRRTRSGSFTSHASSQSQSRRPSGTASTAPPDASQHVEDAGVTGHTFATESELLSMDCPASVEYQDFLVKCGDARTSVI